MKTLWLWLRQREEQLHERRKKMNPQDRGDFYEVMTKLFGNYGKTTTVEMMEEWFEDLIDFTFFQVKNAFKSYHRENTYPPLIASIRKYAMNIPRIPSTNIESCKNIINSHACGKEAFVHGLCANCYNLNRPKNDTDKLREENLKDIYAQAKSNGCMSARDIANFVRKRMRLSPLGQILLNHVQKTENKELGM
jgi:hypothetical protein